MCSLRARGSVGAHASLGARRPELDLQAACDAQWSDDQPITADDVAFTFNDIVLKKECGSSII